MQPLLKKQRAEAGKCLPKVWKKFNLKTAFAMVIGMNNAILSIFGTQPQAAVWFGMTCKCMHSLIWKNIELLQRLMRHWNPQVLPNIIKEDLIDARFIRLIGKPLMTVGQRALFMRFSKKVLSLKWMPWCGVCGCLDADPFWIIGMQICCVCCHYNFMSLERLRDKYGLTLDTVIGGKALVDWACTHCACLRFKSDLWRISTHANDIKNWTAGSVFVWMPHMARILDLSGLARLEDAKRAQAALVVRFVKELHVRRLVMRAQHLANQTKHPTRFAKMSKVQKATFARELCKMMTSYDFVASRRAELSEYVKTRLAVYARG